MSEYHLIPEFWFDGWRRFVNGVYAHGVNNLQPFFPLDLKVHLYDQNSWQEEATKRLFRTAFKEFSPDRLKGCSVEYTWGYSLGMAEGELLDDDAEAIDRHFPTTYLGQKLQAVDESTAEKATQAVEKYIDGFKGKQRIEFNQGKLDGLKSTQEQGEEPTYESDRTNSYMLMLIMEEQLKFLDSWKSFHEFIGVFIEGYRSEGRFAACKKMGQSIGFSPSKQVQKPCQANGTSSLH